MTLSTYRSAYDPCTVILISSGLAPAITPSHISKPPRPLDNLMMQGPCRVCTTLPSPCCCRALISPCSLGVISQRPSSPRTSSRTCELLRSRDCGACACASVLDLEHSPCRLPGRLSCPSLDPVLSLPWSQADISLSFQLSLRGPV